MDNTDSYGSPKVAEAVAMATKSKPENVEVEMRSNHDVSTFLNMLDEAKRHTKENSLQFG